MADQMRAVFAAFSKRDELKNAIEALKSSGVKMKDVTALLPAARGRKDFSYLLRMKVRKGAKIGGWIGFALGLIAVLVVPWLRSVGRLAPIGVEWADTVRLLLVVTAPAYLAVFGFICGTLVGIGTPEGASERYSLYLANGGILLSVQCAPDEPPPEKLTEILEQNGGEDVSQEDAVRTWQDVTKDPRRLSGARWLRFKDGMDAVLT